MKTIIVDQPLATLIAYGIERDLPTIFSSLIGYVDYIGDKVDTLLIASSNNKPVFDTLPLETKEKYLHFNEIKNLPEYVTLPINKFIGIAKIGNGIILDTVVLPTPQKIPSTVKPYNTFFDFEPNSNQVIFHALTELEMKNKKIEELQTELQRRIEEKKKLEQDLLNKEIEIAHLKEATGIIQEDKPTKPNKEQGNHPKTKINVGAVIGIIVAIAVIVLLFVIGGGNLILGFGILLFLCSTIFVYFRS